MQDIKIWFSVIYIGIIFLIFIFFLSLIIKDCYNRNKFISAIERKLKNSEIIDIKDIVSMQEALSISKIMARKYIKTLHLKPDFDQQSDKLRDLIDKLQEDKPFDNCPIETRGILVKLKSILNETEQGILNPIVKSLEELNINREENRKIKKRSYIAYVVGMISFIMGGISLYFTLKSPTIDDIKITIQQTIHSELNNKSE